VEQFFGTLCRGATKRVYRKYVLACGRGLETGLVTGEAREATSSSFGVVALRIALDADLERSGYVHDHDIGVSDDAAYQIPLGAQGSDERAEGDHAGAGEQAGDLGRAAQILAAIGIGESQSLGKPGAQVIAV
jgi:hypothetical protein